MSGIGIRIGAGAASVLLLVAVGIAYANHGSDTDHLPPTRKNMELVSKLEPGSQGPVAPNQIGDLTVHRGFAYVQSGANCQPGDGGFYAIDIRNPSAPSQASFTAALPGTFHDDGAQAITIDTTAFNGDVLAVNNISCPGGGAGGFDLYDVSTPAAPIPLVQGFGDRGGPGTLTGAAPKAHDARSIFIWDAGASAYAVVVDREENHDLDIFDITNPAAPQPVREYDFGSAALQAANDSANQLTVNLHSAFVKQIGSRFKLLAPFGDAGYFQFDAQDPANLQYDGDSDFGGTDPLTGFNPPEGNAHQAEYSADSRYLLTAEEDPQPFRVEHADIDNVGRRDAVMVFGAAPPNALPDGIMNGPTAYLGYACDNSPAVPTPAEVGMPSKGEGEEWIGVVQRGPAFDPDEDYDADGNTNDPDDACFPGQKAANAQEAGWDAVLVVNRHTEQGAAGDGTFCGAGAFPPDQPIVAACTTHAAFHEMFSDTIEYTIPYDDSDVPAAGDSPLAHEGPNIGDQGHKVQVEGLFDGWGYMSLYGATPDANGKFPLLDAHAIKEALNPAYAFGFGDLSIQEQAADPTAPLSYASYRSGGVRVFSFEAGKITEQGAFIDDSGNDMWGVEQFTTGSGERLIAASDRDLGLYVLRYTGPFAPAPLAPGPQPPSGRCAGKEATRLGSPRRDVIRGTGRRDVIAALGGNDKVSGLGGNDLICGGAGKDSLLGGAGKDTLLGQAGNDTLSGGSARDVLKGAAGRDRLIGGPGRDKLSGGPGKDLQKQ